MNVLPGQNEFTTTDGLRVEYNYNVVGSTLELLVSPSNIPYSISEELNLQDVDELISFLTVVRDHMVLVNGV